MSAIVFMIAVACSLVGALVYGFVRPKRMGASSCPSEDDLVVEEPRVPVAIPDGFSDDDYHRLALRIVRQKGPPEPSKSWNGGTVENCERAIERLKAIRSEFGSYEPLRMRRQIMKWMDFYDRQAQEALEDCRTQKSRRNQEEFRKRWAREDERTEELRNHLAGKTEP